MSELRQQLSYLKTVFPETNAPKLPKGVKETFLFDGKKAANLSIEHIHSIASDGLADLIKLDARFRPFSETLFSARNTQLNRELQSKEINEQLNDSIATFLLLLSPYFLLQSAHKVIEYLIRRYKIHLYNVNEIMQCIIPFHESLLFARFVQILNISQTKWHFLEPIQKSGAILTREILAQRCATDFTVLEFIGDTLKRSIALQIDHKTLVSFYTVLVIEYLDYSSIQDVYLKRLLPYVFDGIKSQDKDLKLGSYMVLTQIASKVELAPVAVSTCISIIMKSIDDYNSEDALLCLIFLFQSQNVLTLSIETFEMIINLKYFEAQILQLTKKYNAANFLNAFLNTLVEYSFITKDISMLQRFLRNFPMEKHIASITKQIFNYYLENTDLEGVIKQVLTEIERRYPVEMDKGVYLALQSVAAENREKVLAFVQLTFSQTKHQYIEQLNSTLFLALEHQEASVRILALENLKEVAKQAKASGNQDSLTFVSDSLLARLSDDDPEVLKTVFAFPNLVELVNVEVFINKISALFTRLRESNDTDRKELMASVVQLLLHKRILQEHENRLIPFILEFLLATPEYASTSEAVYASLNNITHPLLSGLFKQLQKVNKQDLGQVNNSVIATLAQNVCKSPQLIPLCLNMTRDAGAEKLVLAVLIKATQLSQQPLIIASALLSVIEARIGKQLISTDMDADDYAVMSMDGLTIAAINVILESLPVTTFDVSTPQAYITEVQKPYTFSENITQGELLQQLFIRLTSSQAFSTVWLKCVKLLLSRHLQSKAPVFLSTFWAAEAYLIPSITQERSLLIASALIAANNTVDYQAIIPSLLVAFSNPHYSVRYAAVCCLQKLKDSSKTTTKLNDNPNLQLDKTKLEGVLTFLTNEIDSMLADHNAVVQLDVPSYFAQYILNHIISSPSSFVKLTLTKIMASCSDANLLLDSLHELVDSRLNQAQAIAESKGSMSFIDARLIGLLLQTVFTEQNAKTIEKKQYFNTFIRAVEMFSPISFTDYEGVSHAFSPCLRVLDSITPSFYKHLSSNSKTTLFNSLTKVLSQASNREVTIRCQQVCKVLQVPAAIIVEAVSSLVRNTSRANLQKLVSLLELVLVMTDISDKTSLVKPLFNTLNFFLDGNFSFNTDTTAEYAVNMIISVINSIAQSLIEQLDIEGQDFKKSFEVATAVKCLTKTTASIRNHAISLIGSLASLTPTEVLSHIVSLLKVMETTLKEKDTFTFDIVEKTLLQIVPELVKRQVSYAAVLDVLVKTFDYLPADRRMKLFSSLVKSISRKNLYTVILKLIEKGVTSGNDSVNAFCTELVQYFRVPKQLYCISELIDFAFKVRHPESLTTQEKEIFDSESHSTEETNTFAVGIIQFVNKFISSTSFLALLFDHEQTTDSSKTQSTLKKIYTLLILNECKLVAENESELIGAVQQASGKVKQLLSIASFTEVVTKLSQSKDSTVRLKALESFNMRLGDNTQDNVTALKDSSQDIIDMLPVLSNVLLREDEAFNIVQCAIVGIELIARRFGASIGNKISAVVPSIIAKMDETNPLVTASAAMCLATICAELKIASLPFLPKIIPKVMHAMQGQLQQGKGKGVHVIQVALLSALELLIKTHHSYISPYIISILDIVIHPAILASSNKKIQQKSSSITSFIYTNIEPRLVIQPALNVYSSALNLGQDSLISLFSITSEVLKRFNSAAAEAYNEQITKFLLKIFDLRRVHVEKVTNIETVEDSIMKLFNTFVLKLNESMFKPLLTQMFQWARKSKSTLAKDSADDYSDELGDSTPHVDRLLVFYKALNTIGTTLKELATPFYAHVFDGIIEDLKNIKSGTKAPVNVSNSTNIKNKKRQREEKTESLEDIIVKKHNLLKIIFSTLGQCFQHDNIGFMQNKSRFESIYKVLADQIDNVGLGTLEMYQDRVGANLAPCLGYLAVAAGHSHWKALQFAVLLKTQNPESYLSKYGALLSLEQFYVKVGQEFIVTLPEMIPYVSEMMADDHDLVLQQVKKLITSVEQITGENVREHLSK